MDRDKEKRCIKNNEKNIERSNTYHNPLKVNKKHRVLKCVFDFTNMHPNPIMYHQEAKIFSN